MQDFYKILDIPEDASPADIKRAFRKAARKYHPDINTGPEAEAAFKDVNAAYDVLKDPEKRAAYDQMRQAPPRGRSQNWDNAGYSFSGGGFSDENPFADIFETLRRQQAAPDMQARVEIDIADAYRGAARDLHLRMPVMGPDGQLRMEDRRLRLDIPKGVTEGQHLRLSGQGQMGDVLVEITFAPHPVYRPDGKDLHMTLPVTPWEAALGGHIVMPTPGGPVDLKIPKNARSGQKLRLRGKGLPGTPYGNLIATLNIVNPDVSTDTARKLFEQMAKDLPFDPRAKLRG